MGKSVNERIITGLDVGTTKVCAIVGELTDSSLKIIGFGMAPSRGIKKGVVINIDETVESIKKAVHDAEVMAGVKISNVHVGIAGGHIKSYNSTGVIAIKNKVVREDDKRRVIDAAQALNIPLDREIIHVLTQEYIVDNQDGIKEPLGMSGIRLEVKVHIVTAAVTAVQNVIKCCTKAGLKVDDIVLEQLASSEAVLTEDEKDLGVVLVDLGGGTTDIVVFKNGSIKHSSVVSLGGNNITNDIAMVLRTATNEAENLKVKYGSAMTSLVDKAETIDVPSIGTKRNKIIPRTTLSEIIEPRIEEIFTIVNREILKSEVRNLIASGVVLTGGGALLNGAAELGEQVFELPVRVGISNVAGVVDLISSPQFSTAVGLVIYGSKNIYKRTSGDNEQKWSFTGIIERMKSFLKDWFE